MRAIYKKLILLFVVLVILKVGLSFLISTPTMFDDEYFYTSMARSFHDELSFKNYNSFSDTYPPLYPMILSTAFIFKDMKVVYTIFKIINALLSSLIIFPIWLLAKEFLNERKAFLVSILCGLWPVGLIFSFFVLSENLFYSLFLFTIYFVYKSFTENKIKWDFLAGIFLGLSFLTKVLGIALVLGVGLSSLIHLFIKRDLSQVKRKTILFGISLLVVIPWFIRNGSLFGWNLGGIMGVGSIIEFREISMYLNFGTLFYWLLVYVAYLLLASGIILLILSLLNLKSENKNLKFLLIIFLTCLVSFIIISAVHSARSPPKENDWLGGRPLGRYVESCIPLIILLSFLGLKFKEYFYKKRLKYSIICALFLIGGYKLFGFGLFPVNATSLSYIGLINLGINYLIPNFSTLAVTVMFIISPLGLLFIKYINFKKLFYIVGVFFIMVNLIAFAMVYYNSNYRWGSSDQMQLGLWLNDNIPLNKEVLLDKDYDTDPSQEYKESIKRAAFWINRDVKMGNIGEQSDYVITKQDSNYDLVKQIGDFRLYKTK